jgi:hypothetical protein
MCAYSSGGGFYAYWDWDACEIITICSLDSEYACAMIISSCLITGHDVGVKAILKPTQSGHALPSMDMELLVKNRGNHTETTDVKMQVYKFEEGPVLFEEIFSGTFPPDGWTTDFWNQSFTNVAGGESPEAVVNNSDQYGGGQYYDNFIMTPPINATGWEKLKISFRLAFQQYSTYGQYCNFYVKWRMNDTSPWKDISPWNNPLGDDSEGDLYEIDCYGFKGVLGDGFQVMFQYVGYYYYYDFFYLDDVKITAFYSIEEYNETVEDIELAPGEELNVEFPSWAPADFGDPDYENIWQDYIVKARSLLEDDRPKNNYKEKIIDLYYPWMHDVELTGIEKQR